MPKKYETQKKLNTFWYILCSTFRYLHVRVFSKVIISTPAHVAVFKFCTRGRCNYGCRPYPFHEFWESGGQCIIINSILYVPTKNKYDGIKSHGNEAARQEGCHYQSISVETFNLGSSDWLQTHKSVLFLWKSMSPEPSSKTGRRANI